MSHAFEITDIDVSTVLAAISADLDKEEIVQHVFDELDTDECEKMALAGDDLDFQTDLAHTEIKRQILEEIGTKCYTALFYFPDNDQFCLDYVMGNDVAMAKAKAEAYRECEAAMMLNGFVSEVLE